MGDLSLGMCPKSLYTKLVDLTLSNQINLMDISSSASLTSLLYNDSESTPVDLISNIPSGITSEGIILEILLKLPVKYIVRSRCVSKLWSSVTLDPYFTNTFENRYATRRPSLLMFLKKKDKLLVFSFPQHKPLSYSSQHVESYNMEYPTNCSQNCSVPLTQSVHGLICCRESKTYPVIWNPSTRQLLTLPKPDKKWKGSLKVFLGYDPIQGKHKVVCLHDGYDQDFAECRVLTLGSARESWRTIETNHKHLPYSRCREQCINGVLYYHAYFDNDYFIMSFDVRTEKFDMINYPSDDFPDMINYLSDDFPGMINYPPDDFPGMLIPYEGKLAGVEVVEKVGIKLWSLEDAKRHEWSYRRFSTTLFRNTLVSIVGSTDTGEFICVPRKLLNSFFILYVDPVKNSSRRVDFKGVADENFRFTHGLGTKHLCDFDANSNHVETFMSLSES